MRFRTKKYFGELTLSDWFRILKKCDVDLYDVCKKCKIEANFCLGDKCPFLETELHSDIADK